MISRAGLTEDGSIPELPIRRTCDAEILSLAQPGPTFPRSTEHEAMFASTDESDK